MRPAQEKIEVIAREIYHAAGVDFSEQASSQLELFERQGYGKLPVSSSCFLGGCFRSHMWVKKGVSRLATRRPVLKIRTAS